ncbi:bifunctional phosphoribosylaminoimidazolecarboxamide formyltransferase/IMP cyclohydrolase [Facilibium subflavum]|uniref:bifunctional phosphoribosylaminoimidazolecarboxamide formyltransferase/IMP cyclohydrolase n=1 Tax=Facilibium subflavum TaxID=2219058 RepID=UPI000E64F572|nr:bifunctional phosphoribosylaminoimidazolecarboxamide formyltransferase/IMP cyclohydrolase [Facilibium subflavum]
MKTIKRALISVSDKTNLVEFAKELAAFNIEILSTGGTAKLLSNAGIDVTEVSDYTGFPEMMDGRVKTLHPKIHGGLLGRRDIDQAVMEQHDIPEIDLVVVNLYPFEKTIQKPNVSFDETIENIDIGGPTMLRSAAKNHRDVAVICDPDDYADIGKKLRENHGKLDPATRFSLACKVFEHTAKYDGVIANHLGRIDPTAKTITHNFPNTLNLQFYKAKDMRYGENPHQHACLYLEKDYPKSCMAYAKQIQGKELSYNNIADTDAAFSCVKSFDIPACVIVKHANPCGVACDQNLTTAYQKAFAGDPTSAFGGIIAFNQPLDEQTAQTIISQQFVEVIIAPEITPEAVNILTKKPNVRVLAAGYDKDKNHYEFDLKKIDGGLLIQDKNNTTVEMDQLRVVSHKKPTQQQLDDLLFAWKVVKFVKSNAIVYAKGNRTIGIGAGQMSRVFSSKIAIEKAYEAELEIKGTAMASDAFFPFRDGVDAAAKAGVSAIIQPGGSMRDSEVIAAANDHDITMVFTNTRHFRH